MMYKQLNCHSVLEVQNSEDKDYQLVGRKRHIIINLPTDNGGHLALFPFDRNLDNPKSNGRKI